MMTMIMDTDQKGKKIFFRKQNKNEYSGEMGSRIAIGSSLTRSAV